MYEEEYEMWFDNELNRNDFIEDIKKGQMHKLDFSSDTICICTEEQKLYDKLKAILMSSAIKNIEDSMMDTLSDDKTPNPIYIPKHIQYRKRGRK